MIDDIKCSHVHSTCSFHRNAYSKPLKKNMFELSFELHSRKVPPLSESPLLFLCHYLSTHKIWFLWIHFVVCFIYILRFLSIILWVYVCWHVHMSTDTFRIWKMVSDPLELELQVDVSHKSWVLGTKLMTSARVTNPL